MALNEAKTRAERINPQLIAAGWDIANRTQVRLEVPVAGYDPTPWNGFTDYSLYEPSGNVIAVVEAKRTARHPRQGEEQLRQYVAEISHRQPYAPFGFMSNGLHTYFWEVGLEHPRMVAGFFSPSDLERLNFIRQNRRPLADISISNAIVDRPYHHEAIRRVAEAFASGKRRALLVMATGTGKTRTAMGLIDLLMRGYWAQKILFLADRDALVEQALSEGFKAHLPSEPRIRIHSASIDPDKRLYVATLQTMGRCFDQFSPAFFDLIIFDEAHRSIFNRFTEVIEYFDARMIGLTATPAAFIDRDTFRTFDCEAQVPTFLYTYQQAVAEKRLVDFRLYQAQTGFQRKGIKGADLSEEDRNRLIELGLDPDSIDYSGTDLEVLVSNKDTLRRQWEEIMNVSIKDRAGNLPGKTIIFAITKAHAERIREVFEEMFPEHVGVLQVIYDGVERVHDGPYGDGLINKFKKQDLPRIAISVDMLDSGINVPEVVNLVFMKPVQSRIKLWQMIGRGTRNQEACKFLDRLPNGQKTEFLIIDFWQNDFGKQTDEYVPADMPLLVRLFNTRLDILAAAGRDPKGAAYSQALVDCRAMLARIPTESYPVRKVWNDVEAAWTDPFWLLLTDAKASFLRLKVAPLLRYVPDVDVFAETFAHKAERLKLQLVRGASPSADLLQSIAEDVSRLPGFVLNDPSRQRSVRLALSSELAQATPEAISILIKDLAGEMKNKREADNSVLRLDLPDFVAGKGFILIGPAGESVHVEQYRKRVEDRLVAIAEGHPALVAIREAHQPTEDQLVDLERQLHNGLSGGQIQLTDKTAWQAYGMRLDNGLGFLGLARHVLALDAIPDYETVVKRAFAEHITRNYYNADQIRFLRSVQDIFISKRRISEADLYDPPLTTFGRNAADRYFAPEQIKQILALVEHLAA
jgi:type I restriction enzyme, R subunit